MNTQENQPSAILVVEADQELQTVLSEVLIEEGYAVVTVASLEEASRQLDQGVFGLILADLFVGPSRDTFTPANLLRRRAWPTPMGLLSTTASISPEAARAAGFACVIPMPFDLVEFHCQVAEVLQQLFSPQQERQVAVVRRFLEALSEEDWNQVGALCTSDVLYHPPRSSNVTSAGRLYGRLALQEFGQAASRRYKMVSFNDLSIYARRNSLVARYTGNWTTTRGERLRLPATTLFRFTGDHIQQVGVHTRLTKNVSRPL